MPFPIARPVLPVVMLCAVAILTVRPALAQFIHFQTAYYATADYTLNTDISGNEVFVSKDPTTFETLPGVVTLTLADGAKVTKSGRGFPIYGDGLLYSGLNVFANHRINITGGSAEEVVLRSSSTANVSGGSVYRINGNVNSTTNVSGGTVTSVLGFGNSKAYITGGTVEGAGANDTATVTITGGAISNATATDKATLNFSNSNAFNVSAGKSATANMSGGTTSYIYAGDFGIVNLSNGTVGTANIYNNSVLNISGGNTGTVNADDFSTVNVSGGFVTEAFVKGSAILNITGGTVSNHTIYQYSDTATVNFAGLSIAYTGAVTGNVNGNTGVFYDVAWTRSDNFLVNTRYFDINGDIANTVPQGITFTFQNGTVVPESGTFTLVGVGLAMAGLTVLRRRS